MALPEKSAPPRVLIVGLDGATPQWLFPLAERGRLPVLARLMEEGASGTLHSTVPPLTPTAWTSLMTGVNPGSHGLFDFIEIVPQDYGIRFTNARSRKAPSIWQILNDRGYRVGVYNVPMTYPPEKVDGFMVSGLDTPDRKSPFVWPPALKGEILSAFGDIPLDPRHLGFMRSDPLRRKVLREVREIEELRAKIFLWLLARVQPEVAMIVFTATDTVQHFFWHYADQTHPWHPSDPGEFATAIEDVYVFVDGLVGRLLERLRAQGGETHVIVMSDHGFGPTSRQVFYPNRFLARLGLLRLRKVNPLFSGLDRLLRRLLPPGVKGKLASWVPALRVWWERNASALTGLDWEGTRAFALEILAIPLGFWVNREGVFARGVVRDALEYEQVVKTIIGELRELKIRAFHRDEVYRGPHVHLAPDVILDWWSEGLVFGRSFPAPPGAPVLEERLPLGDRPAEWSGTHRREGVFVLHGPGVRAGLRLEAAMEDFAPTLFSLLGEAIPAHFEGRVLEEALPGGRREVEETDVAGPEGGDGDTYSEEEAEAIRRKLKSLGYL